METRFGTGERHANRSEFKANTLFLLMFAL